jgi:hypothetical protein
MLVMHAALIPHSTTRSSAIQSLEAIVALDAANILSLRYRVHGVLDCIRWPAADVPQRTDRLWEHTCFEAFVRVPGERSYVELNLAPSGRWGAYRFTDYRTGMSDLDVARPPHIVCRIDGNQMELHATADLSGCIATNADLQLALAAVIEDQDEQKSYWALAHPSERPDFHDAAAFTMDLRSTA